MPIDLKRRASAFFVLTLPILCLVAPSGMAARNETEHPGTAGDGSYTIGPEYTLDPDLTDKGNPKGKSFEFLMPLGESKIFFLS